MERSSEFPALEYSFISIANSFPSLEKPTYTYKMIQDILLASQSPYIFQGKDGVSL